MEKMRPRRIIIEIDEDAYQELVNEIGVKRALDNMEGFIDEFVLLVVKSLYAGVQNISVIKRKKGQKRTKI